ncbi:hypothetical protein RHMOL_Rhmol07G0014200 [Rhododendron molle]|uniref:Uncharacterized protein n=1 Tax=Rhododendron molle TaxID=49168 RepID=A0ACC0MX30_RHOML|nr:hypothetical protein RHMOL_Rhmol07G0014200 [Rhododendron molle]
MLDSVNNEFSKPTPIFGLNLWLLIALITAALTALILLLFVLSSCRCGCRFRRVRRCKPPAPNHLWEVQNLQIKVEKAEHGVLLGSGRTPSSGESKAPVGGGLPPPPEMLHLGAYPPSPTSSSSFPPSSILISIPESVVVDLDPSKAERERAACSKPSGEVL